MCGRNYGTNGLHVGDCNLILYTKYVYII